MIMGSWIHRTRRTILGAGTVTLLAFVGIAFGPASPSQAAAQQPCDIYAAGGTPCVAAHSTVRALYAAYAGNLYQVKRASDGTTANVGVKAAGGAANAATQDTFCANTTCVITVIYDQSGRGNNLAFQGAGGAGGNDTAANAASESLTIAGSKVYSLYVNPGNSYWHNGSSSGMPTGKAPQGAYMVTSGTHVNSGCCFDYGNSETDRKADGAGAMDAIYFGTSCWFGGCTGTGPWVQADLEFGLFSGGSTTWNPNQVPFRNTYVTAMLKNNGTTQLALKGGNAQSGSLTTLYNGSLPGGYNPMKQQGAIILGSGGDCCATNNNQSLGTFYEGAIVAGFPSDATDNAVQANIVAAGYGTGGGGGTTTGGVEVVGGQSGRCLDDPSSSTTNGAQMQIWDCSGQSNQRWTVTSAKQLQVLGKCLDATGQGTTNGTAVIIWDCNGQANQQWNVNANGTIAGVQSGLCLDANGAATANGTKIILWACNGQSNQQWSQRS